MGAHGDGLGRRRRVQVPAAESGSPLPVLDAGQRDLVVRAQDFYLLDELLHIGRTGRAVQGRDPGAHLQDSGALCLSSRECLQRFQIEVARFGQRRVFGVGLVVPERVDLRADGLGGQQLLCLRGQVGVLLRRRRVHELDDAELAVLAELPGFGLVGHGAGIELGHEEEGFVLGLRGVLLGEGSPGVVGEGQTRLLVQVQCVLHCRVPQMEPAQRFPARGSLQVPQGVFHDRVLRFGVRSRHVHALQTFAGLEIEIRVILQSVGPEGRPGVGTGQVHVLSRRELLEPLVQLLSVLMVREVVDALAQRTRDPFRVGLGQFGLDELLPITGLAQNAVGDVCLDHSASGG